MLLNARAFVSRTLFTTWKLSRFLDVSLRGAADSGLSATALKKEALPVAVRPTVSR